MLIDINSPTPETAEGSEEAIEEKGWASIHLAYTMAGASETGPRPNCIHSRSISTPSEPREFGLYNGVSNRTRGWKSKTFGEFVDNRAPTNTVVRRWDGATKTWQPWDNLRRDPELWLRNSNCYVHLYAVGQSKRGPAFRIPFSALLSAKCHPLLDRFLVPIVPTQQPPTAPRSMKNQAYPNDTRFNLYIPAPRTANKRHAFLFHLATRNFFAWLVRKPLVGKDLGSAMITLLSTMQDLRCPDEDNVGDLLSYLDSTGYLDMRSQPDYALAVLHLAEFFQIKQVYIDAFAHCAGMCDRLFLSPEYQHVSSISRKLIRRAKTEMDSRINTAGRMLKTLLDDELSETHLGLPLGARIHLDRFRSFLHAFYTAKFGYFPPAPLDQRNSVFEPAILYIMRHDFECLYGFLVDEGFNLAEDSPFLATGGICTLQCVQSFDMRHKFVPLPQPLPLLPDFIEPVFSRRKSWLSRNDKTKPDQRLLAHAALIRALNMEDVGLLENELVRSYRKFEEDFIFSPVKADKPEKVSQVDARKVRWILIYSIYQTLRSVTEPPREVRLTQDVPYHLAIGTDLLPPWREDRVTYPPPSSHRMPTGPPLTSRGRSLSMPADSPGWGQRPAQPLRINTEIKPDIDYYALANKSATTHNSPVSSTPNTPRRSLSLTRGLSRNGSLRRSLSIFSRHSQAGSPPPTARKTMSSTRPSHRRTPSYHEIVVHGYGNGTQNVTLATEYVAGPHLSTNTSSPISASANRSLSNASKSSDGSAASAGTATSFTTVSTVPSSTPSIHDKSFSPNSPRMDARPRSSSTANSFPELQPRGRSMHVQQEQMLIPLRTSSIASRDSSSSSSSGSHYSTASPDPAPVAVDSPTPPSHGSPASAPSVPHGPRDRRLRNTIGGLEDLVPLASGSIGHKGLYPSPLRVQRDYSNLRVGSGADEWQEVQHEMEIRFKKEEEADVKPMWEQFSDLGGFKHA